MNDTPIEHRIVGTAGHIDHGKSALVKAISGTDPDRLREEQERGITIDLGFADARLRDVQVGFIDVPGHERFVKNMLAGIGGIDAVLLVVAADESIMPQTREHFAICRLLGVRHGVVALTKCDLVDEEIQELVELEIEEMLESSPLAGSPIVRTSAQTGAGLEQLCEALARCLAVTPMRPHRAPLRMPVDRAFTIRGFGTVVTGTLMAGKVSSGSEVELFPSGRRVAVRGIQVYGQDATIATAGQRTALNLQSVAVDEIHRGHSVIEPGSALASQILDLHLEVLPRFVIEQRQRVRFHHGADEVLGRVHVLGQDDLRGGESGYAQIRLERACAARPGDRFIVRRYSPVETIGGGEIVDIAPPKRRPAHADVARVGHFHRSGHNERARLLTEETGPRGITEEQLRLRLGLSRESLSATLHELDAAGRLQIVDGSPRIAIMAAQFDRISRRLIEAAARYHQRFPLRPAVPKEELRAALRPAPSSTLLEGALRALVEREQMRRDVDGYALASHLVRVPDEARDLSLEILRRFERAGLAPPGLDDALGKADQKADLARELLHYLLRQGDLVRVRDDLVFHGEAIAKLVDALQDQFRRGQQFSVAEFKDWARVSRKYAIPLLEYLDTRRITRRVGDARERI